MSAKRSFTDILSELQEEIQELPQAPMELDHLDTDYPIVDNMDREILLHRDIHFGRNFSIMLDYYLQAGKGICDDFSLEHIQKLADMEAKLENNIAPMLLGGADAELIARSRTVYQKLRDIYEEDLCANSHPRIIADLILTEDEEAQKEIQKAVAQGEDIVSDLINLVRSTDFFNPLFPGYGLAPKYAIEALGKIGSSRGIIPIFECLGRGSFLFEQVAIEALKEIGDEAKNFLTKVLQSRPITEDNIHAAMALIAFKEDPFTSSLCLKQLMHEDIIHDSPFAFHLVLACEGLTKKSEQEAFIHLAQTTSFPEYLKKDIKCIANTWK